VCVCVGWVLLTGEQDGDSCCSMYGMMICSRDSRKNFLRTVLLS